MDKKTSEMSWFRLAEAITKNEREKAFFTYRLLSHSLLSDAFKYHIVGDMHYAFNETSSALYSYQKAFHLYYEKKEFSFAYYMVIKMLSMTSGIADYINILNSEDHHMSLYEPFIDDIIVLLEAKKIIKERNSLPKNTMQRLKKIAETVKTVTV